MKILHLISSRGFFGAENMVIELSRSLLKRGDCKPIVGVIQNAYNPHTEIVEVARDNNIETIAFPCRSQFDYHLISKIHAYIAEKHIDLLHSHGYKSNFYGLAGSRKRIPAVTTNHNWLTSHWRLKIYCMLDSIWIRYFDRVVAVSNDVKRDMMKYMVPEYKIEIIDNGIDVERFAQEHSTRYLKNEFGLNDEMTVLGIIGNLGYEKGHEYLFQAVSTLRTRGKRIKILVIGDGYLRGHLEKRAAALGIREDVVFTGYRKDIPELLSMLDIFVLSSVREGLPMVVLEAMASRRPVIATRVGAIPKVIRHGKNGLLVLPSDVRQLSDAIISLTEDREKRQQLANNGYTTVSREFSSDLMCERYLGLYRELVSGHTN